MEEDIERSGRLRQYLKTMTDQFLDHQFIRRRHTWWLTVCIGDDTKAWCKACKCTLIAHKKDLVEHSKTKKHDQSLKRSNVVGQSSKVTDFFEKPIKEPRKIAELKIAAYVAEHSSIKSVDHLGVLIKNLDPTSQVLKDLKLHRSKCTALIRNVISPCFLEDLLEEIGDSHFSVIIDETTTIDTKKVMCLIIRFFSQKKQKIITQFYRLIEIEAADATSLADIFKAQLNADGLNIEKLVGIGVDGANVMVGEHHSFSSILKEGNPELVTIKCVCHSLHLAAEYAFKTLPRFLDFLIKECHNWFSNSTKRQIEYKQTYQLLYEGKTPLKINKLAGTRWLSRYEALVKIVEQWDGLKLHFDLAKTRERCYTTDQLSTMLKSKTNLLYMTFLGTYLKPITMANKVFQASNADPLKLLEEINNLLLTYLTILIPPAQLDKADKNSLSNYDFEQYLMDATYMNFGYAFNEKSDGIRDYELKDVKQRCKEFIIEICKQIQKRLPNNMKNLENCKLLSPKNATSQLKPDITNIAKSFKTICSDVDSVIQEWNALHRTDWKSTEQTEEFWVEVYNFKNAVGDRTYGHVSKLALGILSLPFSNAVVERAFSQVAVIKDKLRNRLAIQTAESILRIRYSLAEGCLNFQPSPKMISRFSSEKMYGTAGEDSETDSVMEAISELITN
ncbi:hypothetical protein ABMA27_010870 [Loxostege sticticalis]|uniref:HAT C-terminal dimerisation domain-containing protein n=1 Tax=Loxostege sticticalis TaxID=481309 RepID=A0ABR3H2I2_LOXSC